MLRLLLLACLIALTGCVPVRPSTERVSVPWAGVAACGTKSLPCDTNGSILGDVERTMEEVQARFTDRGGAFYCRLDEQAESVAHLLVGAAGSVEDAQVSAPASEQCRAAILHAVRYLSFAPARMGGEPYMSIWTLPIGASITVTPAHLTGERNQ